MRIFWINFANKSVSEKFPCTKIMPFTCKIQHETAKIHKIF